MSALMGLSGLAARARPAADHAVAAQDEALSRRMGEFRAVAHQFDALLMNMMMKTMRDSVGENPYFGGGFAQSVWTQMLDQELSKQASQRDTGNGLAQMIVRRYARYVHAPTP